ncbi:FG-GAP-like repeat-containing protein [Streptomyces termitum]|uniref:FG-GAP-like repeat-containing protein n=1 Tax=Streptomyces termitum TaxID=67368 RepID=UPI0033A28F8A
MIAPRPLSPFVRTRTRLSLTLGLLLAALTAALLPWWQPDPSPPTAAPKPAEAVPASAGPRDEDAALAEARRTGKQVPVDTATTATTEIWARPEGGFRTRIHALPQRARNAKGAWAPIDNTLVRAEAGDGLTVRPRNAALPLRLSGGDAPASRDGRSSTGAPSSGASVLAEVELDGHTVAYTWPGALPEPVLDGPRALYSEVLPGVDLLLVAREEGGLAQLLIVKNREAARNEAVRSVVYGLRSKTATFHHDTESGSVRIRAGGREIGSLPTPFAWDSSGRDTEARTSPRTATGTPADVLRLSGLTGIEPGARSAPLPVRLEQTGASGARLRLDAAATGLLDDPDTAFPLFLDPPLNSGTLEWTTAYRPYPTTSFWNGTNFYSGTSDARVGYESQTGGVARSFWRMEFSKSFAGATFSRAAFKVLNNHSWSCTKRPFDLYLTGGISSSTTWKVQPSWALKVDSRSFAHGYDPAVSGCGDGFEAFDVLPAVQRGTAGGGLSNLTLGMRTPAETDTQTWRKFHAASAVLEGDYNRAPTTPTNLESLPGGSCVATATGRVVGKTDLTLRARATDPDKNLRGLRFRFWKQGTSAPAGTLVTTNSTGWATYVVSVSVADKAVYYWDVRAEDSASPTGTSAYAPGSTPCALTIDGSAPPAPVVDETTTKFKRATDDGSTWADLKFGETGPMTFFSKGATRFTYAFDGLVVKEANAVNGSATVTLQPLHAGPTWLQIYAFDAVGNRSVRTDYPVYIPPRDVGDGPRDVGGDGLPDLLVIHDDGSLRSYAGGPGGDLYSGLDASYSRDKDGGVSTNPAGHWLSPAGKAALIAHHQDAYPGDGATDLFARTPDGGFWLYPGDGYGSFDIGRRLAIRLPANTPAPSTWAQLKAVGDVTGDKLPDLLVRAGTGFWVLSGYTGATFQAATPMTGETWDRRDLVNLADVNGDGTPDLLWRNVDDGKVFLRHGKPGPSAGSVALASLMKAGDSLRGDVAYGTSWSLANIADAIGIPDVNGDKIPDIWTRSAVDGQMRVHYPSVDNTNQAAKSVLGVDWRTVKGMS